MRTFLAAVLFAGAAAAQSYTLGTSADPCTGGAALTIFQSTATLRWDNVGFRCTFTVPSDGAYLVEVDALEPCFQSGACAAGQVTAGQRLQNIFVNDQPALSSFDPFASGATNSTAAVRKVIAYSSGGKIVLRVQTVLRSGVLSAVTITPYAPTPAPPDLSGYALKTDLAGYVPYKGATSDVNLGSHGIFASVFDSLSAGATRISLIKGACPATADSGTDATLCLDVDGKLYQVSATGTKTPAGQ